MTLAAVYPVIEPRLNTPALISAVRAMIDKNPAKEADSAGLAGIRHSLGVLRGFNGASSVASAGEAGNGILFIGYLVATNSHELPAVLESLRGLNFVLGCDDRAVIAAGNLTEWSQCVTLTCRALTNTTPTARYVMNRVYLDFQTRGLGYLFEGFAKQPGTDGHTFFLQDRR